MLWSNIRFVCRHYFRSSRSIFWYLLVGTAAMLITPVLSVYLPRVVVQGVTEGWEFERLVLGIGILAAGIALLHVVSTLSGMKYDEKASIGRMKLGLFMEEMMMDCKYQYTEDPQWQARIEEAGNAVFSASRSNGLAGMVSSLRDFVVGFLGISAFSVILGVLHPVLLLILAVTALIPGVLANRVSQYEFEQRVSWRPYEKEIQYVYGNVAAAKAGKDIRLYEAAGFFLKRMDEAIQKRMAWAWRMMVLRLGMEGVNMLMTVVQNGVSLGWIAVEILQGKISVADFAFYTGAVAQFTQFINRFVRSYGIVKHCSNDVGMVREALSYMPEEKAVLTDMPSGCRAPEIRFEHVSFAYPGSEKPVLEDISFCVMSGEKIALVGTNGAGKTTLVKLLCGFYQPTSGQILIDGATVSRMEEGRLYSMISAVFQDMLVLPFSVLDNVAVRGGADVERVRRCLEKAGLSGRFPNLNQPLVKGIQDGGENLSGGEEQKLLLARALYKEAPVLVLDEPTAALDPLAESGLYEKYYELTHEKTSFFISHRLASTSFCDRILLLEDGRILEEGTHRELLEKGGLYTRMFKEQSKYYKEDVMDSGRDGAGTQERGGAAQ